MDPSQLSVGLAFVAGLASFLSPCMLPLVPIYLAQLVGQSVYQSPTGQDDRPPRFITFLNAVMFVLGFTLPFLLLGLCLDQVSRVLRWLKPHLGKIEVGTGVVLILVGVMIYFNWLVYLNRYFTPIIRL